MRRNILLALIAALALAVGLSNVAVADQGAGASAKAGKKGKRGKGKACKGNRGKGRSRGKARRSADASAKARKGRKGKGKRRGCKGGARNANWVQNGEYSDPRSDVGVKILARGKRVSVVLPGSSVSRCLPVALELEASKTTVTANKLIATWVPGAGVRSLFVSRYELTVLPNYSYKLVVDAGHAFPDQPPCSDPGATTTGRLSA